MRTTLTVVVALLVAIVAAAFVFLRADDALMVAFGTLVAAAFAVLPVGLGALSRRHSKPGPPADTITLANTRSLSTPSDIGPTNPNR